MTDSEAGVGVRNFEVISEKLTLGPLPNTNQALRLVLTDFFADTADCRFGAACYSTVTLLARFRG